MEDLKIIRLLKIKTIQVIVATLLFFPMFVYAASIAITPIKAFPAVVPAYTVNTAQYKITNITANNLLVTDQTNFAPNSGLAITANSCHTTLAPNQNCFVQVVLRAKNAGKIAANLQFQVQPGNGIVQFPINILVRGSLPNISLEPVAVNEHLPALRDPIVATYQNSWLIMSGSLKNFHDFNQAFNKSLYVYNPSTKQLNSINIETSNLPVIVKKQLASSNPEFLQDEDTLYIIGGFYTPDNKIFTTLNTITAVNISGMVNAIINHDNNLARFVSYRVDIPEFRVTGGQLGKIGNYFYLSFGQNCVGNYCGNAQRYTNSIYQFITDPTLLTTTVLKQVSHPDLDGSGWRRRDYTLAPIIINNAETLFAEGGPFTPGDDALVWTNGINFNTYLQANSNFINQQANQYLAPHLSIFSASNRMTYVATFSGLSNLFWGSRGLQYNNETPYGNILDLITINANANTREYANLLPICSNGNLNACIYTGMTAEFLPAGNFYDQRSILQLDALPTNTKTLVGYVYGGLNSTSQDVFGTDASFVTNQVFAVYINPADATVHWQDITNLV